MTFPHKLIRWQGVSEVTMCDDVVYMADCAFEASLKLTRTPQCRLGRKKLKARCFQVDGLIEGLFYEIWPIEIV